MAGDMVVVWSVTVLVLWLTHWFRWPSELHYLSRYVIGVLCLNVPFSFWLLRRGYDWDVFIALGGCVVFGGLAVLLAYAWDWSLNNWCRRRALEATSNDE